ncbi:methyltransferase domain-containing protein [Spirulina sp. 06S082]|uniref:methyltransferase domain-containing protein n=1 Tax=Spirulina sp. 06S082 TaxID=3110248 RepID=UPI002B1FBA77|nr:methyltransferase domain-containing protein [Spirulina sp. 06S082]MEA5469992.1 methyltransferase domain-containing protein [Spirulina sp. 06S082]
MNPSKFTEIDTEVFYNAEDSLYRSFWDSEGSLHWGYFSDLSTTLTEDFIPACQHWNEYMLEQSGITSSSRVLDIGCGNGNTAIWLAQKTNCEVIGIDLSQVRIDNAREKASRYPSLQLQFAKESATNLSFADGTFTHIWSQATLYHVHQRELALKEISRVLQESGIVLFDDLITPSKPISERSRQYVYDRLLFEPTYSHSDYIDILSQIGLMVLNSKDLSQHLHKSYELLSQLAKPQYPDLSVAYERMCEAIATEELGWSFFLAEKVSDRLSWIYETKDNQKLQSKYDAWSRIYDKELDRPYRISPIQSARALAQVLPDKAANILDAGAGTGMVGEALAEQGYTHLTAIDLSEEMLAVAREKQIYQTLHQGNLDTPLTFCEPASFDAIISVGVFTFGHAPPGALHNLNILLKLGGYFVLTVRVDYHDENAALHKVLEELSWTLVNQEKFTIFETEPMYALVFQKH